MRSRDGITKVHDGLKNEKNDKFCADGKKDGIKNEKNNKFCTDGKKDG